MPSDDSAFFVIFKGIRDNNGEYRRFIILPLRTSGAKFHRL